MLLNWPDSCAICLSVAGVQDGKQVFKTMRMTFGRASALGLWIAGASISVHAAVIFDNLAIPSTDVDAPITSTYWEGR